MARVEWNQAAVTAEIKRELIQRLTTACILVVGQAKRLLSVAGTGRVRGKKSGPIARSAPGDPPHKQTGRLRASVTYEVDESNLTARVGTNVDYGMFLELGTKKGLAPRPWLRRALAEMQSQVKKALGG